MSREVFFGDLDPRSEQILGKGEIATSLAETLRKIIDAGFAADSIESAELLQSALDDWIVFSVRTRKTSYERYLKTHHWARTREQTLLRCRHECQVCGAVENLQVHHKNYDRVGREYPTDLVVLCRDCHAKFHDKLP